MATSGFGEPFRGGLCGSMHPDKHAMPSEPHGCSVDILSQQSGPLSWVCLHNTHSERWLSVLPALRASWGKGLLLLHLPDRQTDRHTDRHSLVPQQQWEPNTHSSTSAVLQSSVSLCSYHCYHLMLGPPAYKPHVVLVWATIDCD